MEVKVFNREKEPRLFVSATIIEGEKLDDYIAKKESEAHPGLFVVLYRGEEDSVIDITGFNSSDDVDSEEYSMDAYQELTDVCESLEDDHSMVVLTFSSKFEINQFFDNDEISVGHDYVSIYKDGVKVAL